MKSLKHDRVRAISLCIVFSVFALFLSSCNSDYTEEAMEKAREYALEHTKDLTELQRNVIRYQLPAVRRQTIRQYESIPLTEYDHIPRNSYNKGFKAPHLDYVRSIFVWDVPGLDAKVVVLGEGYRSGRAWRPLKIIYTKKEAPDYAYENARREAVNFVCDNMLYLSTEEVNRVRFSEAEVCCTCFDLSYFAKNGGTTIKSAWESYLEDRNRKVSDTQFSLIWKADKKDHFIVLTGMGKGKTLEGWRVISARVFEGAMLDKYLTGEIYHSPADYGKITPLAPADSTVKIYRKDSWRNTEKNEKKEKKAETGKEKKQ